MLALLDHVGWDRCRVFGVSFGGMELAVTAPDRVVRLALSCTSRGGVGGSSYPLHELADLLAAERVARSLLLLDTRFTPDYLTEHPNDRGLADMMVAREGGEKSVEQVRGEAGQLAARAQHDVCDRLDHITCPTSPAPASRAR